MFLLLLITNQVQFDLAVVNFLLLDDEVLPPITVIGGVVARARIEAGVRGSV